MQRTCVQSLVWEDSTCYVATKLVPHNDKPVLQSLCTTITEAVSRNYWSPRALEAMLRTREATAVRSPCTATNSSPRSQQLDKARAQQQRPSAAKNKEMKLK